MARLHWQTDPPDCWHGMLGTYHLCTIERQGDRGPYLISDLADIEAALRTSPS